MNNIWVSDLADMQLLNRQTKENVFYYVLLTFIVNMHGFFLQGMLLPLKSERLDKYNTKS